MGISDGDRMIEMPVKDFAKLKKCSPGLIHTYCTIGKLNYIFHRVDNYLRKFIIMDELSTKFRKSKKIGVIDIKKKKWRDGEDRDGWTYRNDCMGKECSKSLTAIIQLRR